MNEVDRETSYPHSTTKLREFFASRFLLVRVSPCKIDKAPESPELSIKLSSRQKVIPEDDVNCNFQH
jgi:hypothetical protein